MNSMVWLRYLLDCLWPLSRIHPPIVVLYSCRIFAFKKYVWMMTVLSTMLTRMKIGTLIFHVANLLKMLTFFNLLLNWSRWMWTMMKQSNTLELDCFGVIQIMKVDIFFIIDTSFVFIIYDFFLRSGDLLGKRKLNVICTWIWSCLTELLLCCLLI